MNRYSGRLTRWAACRWLLVVVVLGSTFNPVRQTLQSATSWLAPGAASGQGVATARAEAPASSAARFTPSITILRPADGALLTNAAADIVARVHAPSFGSGYHVNEIDTWPDGSKHASAGISPKGVGTIAGSAPTLTLTTTALLQDGGNNVVELDLVGPSGILAKDVIPVTVDVAAKPVDIAARGLEVTQAFNIALASPYPFTPGKSEAYAGEPLVAGKSTVVRLYGTVPPGSGVVKGVDALLYGKDAHGVDLPGSPLVDVAGPLGTAGARVNLDPKDTLIQQRLNPAKSWNFVLPPSWTHAGTVVLRGVVNPGEAIPEPAGAPADNDFTVKGVTFFATSSLQIRPYLFAGRIGTTRTSAAGGRYLGAADPAFTNGWLNSIMPVADGSIAVKTPANPTISTCVGGCNTADVYGSLLDTAQAYWLRDAALDPGLAYAPPVSPYVLYDVQLPSRFSGTTEGAAPIGGHAFAATPQDARTTSYEILHDLGLQNAGNVAGERGESWPFCEGGLALTCAGAPDTTIKSANATDTRPLAFDTSPTRGSATSWNAARDALGQAVVKDPVAHTPYAGLEPAARCKQAGLMQYHDVMFAGDSSGGCSDLGVWISTINYCRAFFTLSGLGAPTGDTAADFCKRSQGMLTSAQIAGLAGASHAASNTAALQTMPAALRSASSRPGSSLGAPASPYMEISGVFAPGVSATAKTVPTISNAGPLTLFPMFTSPRPIALNAPSVPELLGVLVSGTGSILAVQTVVLREISNRSNPGWLSFSFELPLKPGAKQMLLVKTSKGHNTVLAVVGRPAVPPAMSIVPGEAGFSVPAGKPLTLAWTVPGKSGDSDPYDIALSCNGGATYQSLAVDLKATSLALDPSTPCGGSFLLRVATSNGFDSVVRTAGPYHSAMRAPSIGVVSPGDGTTVPPVTLVTLAGLAIDPRAGMLSGKQLAWTSDRDGFLGYGAVVATSNLSLGTHHISLQATAPDGQSALRTITLKVARLHLPGAMTGTIVTRVVATPTPIPPKPTTVPIKIVIRSYPTATPTATHVPGAPTATATSTLPPLATFYPTVNILATVNAKNTQVASAATASAAAANATATQVAANASATADAANATATADAANATATQVAANATATQVAANATATQVAANATATQVAANGTATQVAANATATQVAVNATATKVAANATATKAAANATATKVAANATATQAAVDATNVAATATQVAVDATNVAATATQVAVDATNVAATATQVAANATATQAAIDATATQVAADATAAAATATQAAVDATATQVAADATAAAATATQAAIDATATQAAIDATATAAASGQELQVAASPTATAVAGEPAYGDQPSTPPSPAQHPANVQPQAAQRVNRTSGMIPQRSVVWMPRTR